jgi:hypothetical protein
VNIQIVQELSSSSVTVELNINNGSNYADDVNDGDNRRSNPLIFVTLSEEVSDSSLPSTLNMTDEDAAIMYEDLIGGEQALSVQ